MNCYSLYEYKNWKKELKEEEEEIATTTTLAHVVLALEKCVGPFVLVHADERPNLNSAGRTTHRDGFRRTTAAEIRMP